MLSGTSAGWTHLTAQYDSVIWCQEQGASVHRDILDSYLQIDINVGSRIKKLKQERLAVHSCRSKVLHENKKHRAATVVLEILAQCNYLDSSWHQGVELSDMMIF